VPHFLFIFIEVKEFLLVLNIFSRFLFVKVIIKDFCWIFGCGIFRGFLAGFCRGVFGRFLALQNSPYVYKLQ